MSKSKIGFINTLYFSTPLILKNTFATCYGIRESTRRFGAAYHDARAEIRNNEFLSNEEVSKIQFLRLKSFLIFVLNHSDYYKAQFKLFDFNPQALQSVDELRMLPTLNKEEVRNNASNISCKQHFYNTYDVLTSGSSGKPLKLFITDKVLKYNQAILDHLYIQHGLNHKSKMAKLAGHQVAHIGRNKPPFWVSDFYNRSIYLSSYHLNDENILHYINKLSGFMPEVLEGYPSSLYTLAKANKKYNGNINPKFIRTGSETLFDYQRNLIEESFNCKVYNIYGSGENCVKAVECTSGKLHIQTLFGFTEILDNNLQPVKPGEEGMIVATGFLNEAFPLIRYETGDIARISKSQECSCGRNGLILDCIVGRYDDFVITTKDVKVGTAGLSLIFKDVPGIINVQIHQSNKNEILILIVTDTYYSEDSEKRVFNNVIERLDPNMIVRIKYVDQIQKEKSGKYLLVKSDFTRSI